MAPATFRTFPAGGRRSSDRGFGLVEMLVVVLVIGLIAGIAIPVYLNQRQKAVVAGMKAEARSIAAAQEAYMVDNPSAVGIADFNVLKQYGWRHTPGNMVWVYVKYGVGYYTLIRNNGDGKTPAFGWGVIYDSSQGGFLGGGNVVNWYSYANSGAVPDTNGSYQVLGSGVGRPCDDVASNPCP